MPAILFSDFSLGSVSIIAHQDNHTQYLGYGTSRSRPIVVLSIVNKGCHFLGITLGPGIGQEKGPKDPACIDEW